MVLPAYYHGGDPHYAVMLVVLAVGGVVAWCIRRRTRPAGEAARLDLRPARRLIRLLTLGGVCLGFASLAAFSYHYTGPVERLTVDQPQVLTFGPLGLRDWGFGVAPLSIEYGKGGEEGRPLVFVGYRVRVGLFEIRDVPHRLPQLG